MQVGISTASLFVRKNTEQALQFLAEKNVNTAEVFLESYCEYKPEFAKVINEHKGNVNIHSVHTLTTQFEPQLFSINERAQADSFELLDSTMQVANKIGAKYYTFHGPARLKRIPLVINFERVGECAQKVIDVCAKHGVQLAYENVHWSYYNYVGFFDQLRRRTKGLKATLDIKQARQSSINPLDLIKEMGEDIVTVHLSDVREDGKMCLPGKGITDFFTLFNALKDVGFDGAFMLEVYQNDYQTYDELMESFYYVKELASKIFIE